MTFGWLILFAICFLAENKVAAQYNDDNCPPFMKHPLNTSQLVAGEKTCPMTFIGGSTCYSCCRDTTAICCDDGTCMDYDAFCRYPPDCCRAPYCDTRCCPSTYGTPCGPVCAPKAYTICCNQTTGQLCSKQDSCCNDFCCPSSMHCCPEANTCAPQGQTCCGTAVCDEASHCCQVGGGGSIPNFCCPVGSECIQSGPACCPLRQFCPGNLPDMCCNLGSHCCGDHCCPDSMQCCGRACCPLNHTCCDGKCCITDIGCQPDHECCPIPQVCGETCCHAGESCCADHHCCPAGTTCCGEICCPSGQDCCAADNKCYADPVVTCPPGVHQCCRPGTTCNKDPFGRVTCCEGNFCPSTGVCCPAGQFCNDMGHCCSDGQKRCPNSANACFSQDVTCCNDDTACPPTYPTCLWEGGTPYCCPAGYNSVCNGVCRPPEYNSCQCCGESCCVSPYGCDWNQGKCFHDYDTGTCHWWSSCSHHHDEQQDDGHGRLGIRRIHPSPPSKFGHQGKRFLHQVLPLPAQEEKVPFKANVISKQGINLPPPPSGKISPKNIQCFQDFATMNDTCTAWDCLEDNIMNCGHNGPVVLMQNVICNDFQLVHSFFNTLGQQFLNCTANCVTAELVNVFRAADIKLCCSSLVRWLDLTARFDCWKNCGFCTAYETNRLGFKALIDKSDPGTDPLDIFRKFCV